MNMIKVNHITLLGMVLSILMGTVGLSISVTSADSSIMTLINLIFGMILGRLEIFIVLVGIYSGWKLLFDSILTLPLTWEW